MFRVTKVGWPYCNVFIGMQVTYCLSLTCCDVIESAVSQLRVIQQGGGAGAGAGAGAVRHVGRRRTLSDGNLMFC